MPKCNIRIIILTVLFFCLFSVTLFAAPDDHIQINGLTDRIDKIESENAELKKALNAFDKDKIISSLENKESKLIDTADHTINRINFWIAVFSIGVTVSIAVGSISTYFLQKSRFDKLEKDIDKYKNDIENAIKELNSAKNELIESKNEFVHVKSESQSAMQSAAATQEYVSSQFVSFQDNYNFMKKELEKIQENVQLLASQAEDSKDKAKESENKAKASEYFSKAYTSNNIDEQIELYSKVIKYDDKHDAALNNRGTAYSAKKEHYKALEDYNSAIDIAPEEGLYYRNKASTLADISYEYIKSSDSEKAQEFLSSALKNFEKAMELFPEEKKDELSDVLNDRADVYRRYGKIKLALADINKSLELCNDNGYSYSTLAEICAELNDDEGFYKNTELALINKCPIQKFAEEDSLYDKYKNSDRFINLLNKYKIC